MKVDPEDFRRHYASLSDEALLEVDRDELIPVAQKIYDEEVERRNLLEEDAADLPFSENPQVPGFDVDPDWVETGAIACSAYIRPGGDASDRMVQARDILKAAGIPAEIRQRNEESDNGTASVCEVLVPGNLSMYAASVLDKEIFNAEVEESYREYFSSLTEEELRSADRKLLFAGLVDRLERARSAYDEEVAKRAEAAGA